MSHIGFLLMFSCFYVIIIMESVVDCAIYNRYHPVFPDQTEKVSVNRPFQMELGLLATYGASQNMRSVARQAIVKIFSGSWQPSGDEANYIGEAMEQRFGGFWAVYIFDVDYDAAYTIIRRSPSYMLWKVNNRAILVAKEGSGQFKNENSILI